MIFWVGNTLEFDDNGKLIFEKATDVTCNAMVVDNYDSFFITDHVLVSY